MRSQCDICKQVFAHFPIPGSEYENQINIASNFGSKVLSHAEIEAIASKYPKPTDDHHHEEHAH